MPRRAARPTPRPCRTLSRTRCRSRRADDLADADLRDGDDGEPSGELTNGDLARIFHDIGDMLEVKGELVVQDRGLPPRGRRDRPQPGRPVAAYRAGDAPKIPGVGAAISDKIEELATTGRMAYYDKLVAEVPPSLVELLRIPGLGPKTVRQISGELGIDVDGGPAPGGRSRHASDRQGTVGPDGAAHPRGHRPPRVDPRTDAPPSGRGDDRRPHRRPPGARPGRLGVEPAGSFRRRKESIGDLDLLAETDDGPGLIERFTTLGVVDHVLNKGGYKAAVRLMRGPQVDLMVMAPGTAGTYRSTSPGSKEHNVRLRERARDMGWSLSEKGFLRIGEDGEPLTGDGAELRTFATESEAYAFLGLTFIEPELREDDGEIEAALAGRLPSLIELADLRGDLHSHSDWSDGTHRSRSWPRRPAVGATPTRS